ncbi:DinB family protein [Rhodocaloribacter litoris]|uniref:DinB family protein n=1 Tax=Rhodocaloribacter litoris TaxID=2558931 RepID=UPI0014246885|nr:DinB family protein [Rhodocaloribacter litoris]QXD14088.1 DinB family protein [Rhodocaloribacter litoris]
MKPLALLTLLLVLLPPARLHAQEATPPENPVITSLKGLHDITVTNLLKTAEMLDEKMYAYRPTDEVRTAGQILAHVANAQFFFCATAAGEANPNTRNYEETATTRDAILAALKDGFDYCTGVYARLTDAEGSQMRDLFGRKMAASAILAFNAAHNYEHYGNLVTYMRLNGIVPPSSM